MGGKPRKTPIDKQDDDGLLVIDKMEISENGKSKSAAILVPFAGEALEFRLHRKMDDHDITGIDITKVNFKRVGRGMAAMKPGGVKELVITVRYRDGS